MRDPARIKRICRKLQALWETQPDTRLCQLASNLSYNLKGIASDSFYVEDDVMEKAIDAALIKAGIAPEAFEYEADVTPEGVKMVQDRVKELTGDRLDRAREKVKRQIDELTVEQSQADQIATYGSVMKPL